MGKVSQQERTAGRPQLTPDRVGNPEVFIGTVVSVAKQKSQYEERGEQYVLTFKEADEFVFRLNKTGLAIICESISDETDGWKGERIPLVRTRTSVGGNQRIVFQVAPANEWAAALRKPKGKAK